MKYRYTFLFFFSLFIAQVSWGQTSNCEYTLELRDGFGDGWNGASLLVSVNGEQTFYDLNNRTDNGFLELIPLPIQSGDQVSITYSRGLYDEEVSWFLFDPQGDAVIGFSSSPETGEVFNQALECPPCIGPKIDEIFVDDVRAFTADISWIPTDLGSDTYVIEYGSAGFTPGAGTTVQTMDDDIRLSGLMENTTYDFYLSNNCENGESSKLIGPVTFTTRFANDVRISGIQNPITSCDLGFNDSVKVIIQNLGGNPQTLIPFKYAVNGVDAMVTLPTDGLYTGVLGKDSTDLANFDQTFNFGNPGEYTISAWTQLAEDSATDNDTFEVTIVSIPEVFNYPYFENFEVWGGGWTVADESLSSSWERGRPAGSRINSAAGGNNAWVTNLNGSYNFGEQSYLVSPCFDFSSFDEDPQVSFSLFVDTEEEFDGAWLELSTDEGESWTKVGASDTGLKWYNNAEEQQWDGNGGFSGWAFASNVLSGTAGEERVRLRFVFSSDINVNREGIGIDNFLIASPFNIDLAAVSVESTSGEACGSTDDNVSMVVSNLGASDIQGFDLNYRIDDGEVITESVNERIEAGGQFTYLFNTPFNSFEKETLNITAWVNVPAGDQFMGNDTVKVSISTLRQLPFGEDFEVRRVPDGWQTSGVVTNQHGNRSYVLSAELSASNTSFSAVSPLIGPVSANDSLQFEYRFVSMAGEGSIGQELGPGDELVVQISTDCGQVFETLHTINENNHVTSPVMTSKVIYLDAYEGETVRFRFLANRGGGNYWVDIDNINIARCPPSLALDLTASDEVGVNAGNGSASVAANAGESPYTYLWSNGDATKMVSKLSAGIYTVTVTDRFGCQDEGQVLVGLSVNTEDIPEGVGKVMLSPNPTRGISRIELELNEAQDVHFQVLNMMGQPMLERNERAVVQGIYPIDLTDFPDGLYVLRIKIGDRQLVRKLIKSR